MQEQIPSAEHSDRKPEYRRKRDNARSSQRVAQLSGVHSNNRNERTDRSLPKHGSQEVGVVLSCAVNAENRAAEEIASENADQRGLRR